MKRNLVLLFAIVLLLVTTHRLPAPIQEIPETPAPSPTLAPTPEVKSPPQPPPMPMPKSELKKGPVQRREKRSSAVSENTVPAPKPTNETPSTNGPTDLGKREVTSNNGSAIPKGSVHLVVHTDSDIRKIFNYFIFPKPVAQPGKTGLYRLEVSPDGTVAAVTILQSMGPAQDVAYMKAFVQWRAVPGPLRMVDVPRRIFEYHHVVSH